MQKWSIKFTELAEHHCNVKTRYRWFTVRYNRLYLTSVTPAFYNLGARVQKFGRINAQTPATENPLSAQRLLNGKSTKLCRVLKCQRNEPDLQTHVKNWRSSIAKNWELKLLILWRFSTRRNYARNAEKYDRSFYLPSANACCDYGANRIWWNRITNVNETTKLQKINRWGPRRQKNLSWQWHRVGRPQVATHR